MTLAPFSTVVADHGPMVRRVCGAMLTPADADDAWAETFLAALRAYPDLDDGANVAAWLVTIARRKAIDVTRKQGRQAIPVGEVPEPSRSVDGPEPADEALRTALAQLSDRQRTAVIAHHVAGLPYAEVAVMLDSTPAAARRSAADGIAKLRSQYRMED